MALLLCVGMGCASQPRPNDVPVEFDDCLTHHHPLPKFAPYIGYQTDSNEWEECVHFFEYGFSGELVLPGGPERKLDLGIYLEILKQESEDLLKAAP